MSRIIPLLIALLLSVDPILASTSLRRNPKRSPKAIENAEQEQILKAIESDEQAQSKRKRTKKAEQEHLVLHNGPTVETIITVLPAVPTEPQYSERKLTIAEIARIDCFFETNMSDPLNFDEILEAGLFTLLARSPLQCPADDSQLSISKDISPDLKSKIEAAIDAIRRGDLIDIFVIIRRNCVRFDEPFLVVNGQSATLSDLVSACMTPEAARSVHLMLYNDFFIGKRL